MTKTNQTPESWLQSIQHELGNLADPERAVHSQRFFKTGPGEYGEGDIFRGIRVPELRKLARKKQHAPLEVAESLVKSDYHEDRLLGLFMLVRKYQKGDDETKDRIFRFYLDNREYVNNWDLVDSSAEHIIGAQLKSNDLELLTSLAKSASLWDRRIAMLSTFHHIKKGKFHSALILAELLVNDQEDLIQKAVGWMLREIGNRERMLEEKFLQQHYKHMPRTMLRYAIEKFPEPLRQSYLQGEI